MLSVREQIMASLETRFLAFQKGVNNYTTTWNVVIREPLDKKDIVNGDALEIIDIGEGKQPGIQHKLVTLNVSVSFWHKKAHGDVATTELNRMLLDVQRGMTSDITCGGLCLNINETRNEHDVDGPGDSLIGGISFWEITYRHKPTDPSVKV